MPDDTVEVYLELVKEWDRANLYTDGEEEIWIPHSHVRSKEKVGRSKDYKLVITRYIAIVKGII